MRESFIVQTPKIGSTTLLSLPKSIHLGDIMLTLLLSYGLFPLTCWALTCSGANAIIFAHLRWIRPGKHVVRGAADQQQRSRQEDADGDSTDAGDIACDGSPPESENESSKSSRSGAESMGSASRKWQDPDEDPPGPQNSLEQYLQRERPRFVRDAIHAKSRLILFAAKLL